MMRKFKNDEFYNLSGREINKIILKYENEIIYRDAELKNLIKICQDHYNFWPYDYCIEPTQKDLDTSKTILKVGQVI
jgi:hypothetical protein